MSIKIRNLHFIYCITTIIICLNMNNVHAQTKQRINIEITQLALKTNVLYDGAMTPNIGAEMAINDTWSVAANWIFAWWSNNHKHRFWRINVAEVEGRYWLGNRSNYNFLEGQHLGYYFICGKYDFERGHRGYQSDFSINTGISYGYALKIANSWYIDFVLGIGYVGGRNKKYVPRGNAYCLVKRNTLSYFGPSKAEISIVWHIGDILLNKRKGGSYE